MTHSIEVSTLKALLLCAAKNDVRYFLNSILLESSGGTLRAVSTDGNCILVVDLGPTDIPAGAVIVPRASVELAIKAAGKAKCVMYTPDTLAGIPFTAVEGKFPDWRRVIPRAPLSEAEQFGYSVNGEILARAQKAFYAVGGSSKIPLEQCHGGALRMCAERAVAVVMCINKNWAIDTCPLMYLGDAP